MKKNIILMVVLLVSIVSNVSGQTYYNMFANPGGEGEFIANLKTWSNYYGIQFATNNRIRAMVNNAGQWCFLNPTGIYTQEYLNKLNANMAENSRLTVASDGFIGAYGFYLNNIGDGNGTYLEIVNNGWGNPLIYAKEKVLRLGGRNGVGIWGNYECYNHSKPNLMVNWNSVESYSTFYVKKSDATFTVTADESNFWVGTTTNHGMYLGTNGGSNFYIDANHKVYIGLTTETVRAELKNKYFMFVNDGILSEDFAIAPVSSWADFVFNKDYKLRDIEEVESFIEENKHLPDVPSAKDVAEDGYSQHEMNKVLLQKIEELTLYTIKQQKQIDQLLKERENEK